MTVADLGFLAGESATLSEREIRVSRAVRPETLSSAEVQVSWSSRMGKPHPVYTTPFRDPSGRFLAWATPAVETLKQLLELPPNWDSYGTKSIEPELASEAMRLLTEIMSVGCVPLPAFVPTAEGGIQLDWAKRDMVLEIELSPHGAPYLYFRDATGKEVSGDLYAHDACLNEALLGLIAPPDSA